MTGPALPPAAGTPETPDIIKRLPFYYGWIVVAVAFVTMAIGVNARTSFSLLFPAIVDEFGWDRGDIAAIFSIGFMVSTGLTPVIGFLMDRFGPRLTIPLGAIFVSVGMYTATLSSEIWHFYLSLGVLVVGGSIFMSYIGHTLFLPNWFERRRGLAVGIAFAGVGAGSMALFPWMQATIDSDGWRTACLVIAAVSLFVLVPLGIIFQRRLPADFGLLPDGDTPDENKEASSAGGRNARAIVNREWVETDWTLALAMRTGPFWYLMIAFIGGLYVWYAVQVHQTKYLIDIGFSRDVAALALGLVSLGGVVGQIWIGQFSDRMGREWAWTLSALGFLLTYAVLYLLRIWPEPWLMYTMVILQGALGYGLASVFGSVPADLFAGPRYGQIFGVLAAAAGAGAAAGPWLTGLMFDWWQDYDAAFGLAIVVSLISIAAMWLAAPRKVRLVSGQIPPDMLKS
jgi:MFS family permease